jgi:hypothetical protein
LVGTRVNKSLRFDTIQSISAGATLKSQRRFVDEGT